MVRFINPDNGMVFDGSKPYVFWFDEGQSVNINYIRKIYFVSTEARETVTLNSDIFSLLDVSGIEHMVTPQETFDGQPYYDLSEMRTDHLVLDGVSNNGVYVYVLYIHAFSKSIGEYTDEFVIGGTSYTVGADFYCEDERLTTNLSNMGVEIPYDVQKAVYEQNVHEEAQNNILLNRKYKELLMNYWDIVANKGNYTSLRNSLSWFEYGDLLAIREYWNEPGTDYNYYDKINTLVDEEIAQRIRSYMKKTYMGVYFALQHVTRDADGHIVYDGSDSYIWNDGTTKSLKNATLSMPDMDPDAVLPGSGNAHHGADIDRLLQIGEGLVNVDDYETFDPSQMDMRGSNWEYLEPVPGPSWDDGNQYFLNEMNPVLVDTDALHTVTDLALKMTLVGNYYSTFFLPIQMDLIHSTIESIVFNVALKILHIPSIYRYDTYGVTRSLRCDVTSDFRLQPLEDLYVYPDTPFGGYDGETEPIVYMGIEEGRHVPVPDPVYTDEDTYKSVTAHRWGGVGCLVELDIDVPLEESDFVMHETLVINEDIRTMHEVYENNGTGKVHVHFKILLQKPGKNNVSVLFRTASGLSHTWGRVFDIQPYMTHHIKVCTVTRMDRSEVDGVLTSTPYTNELNDYVLSQLHVIELEDADRDKYIYRQYINCGPDVGLNHVLALRLDVNSFTKAGSGDDETVYEDRYLYDGEDSVYMYGRNIEDIYDDCVDTFADYYWYMYKVVLWTDGNVDDVNPAPDPTNPDAIDESHVYIIVGICKDYHTGTDDRYVHVCDSDDGVLVRSKRMGTLRMKDDVLFLPMLHRYNDAGDRYEFNRSEMLCVMPTADADLGDEYALKQGKNFSKTFEGCVWEFRNTTTGKVCKSDIGVVHQPFMLPYDRTTLDRGYYDLVFRYDYGGGTYENKRAALLIR